MNTKLMAANWKMYKLKDEAAATARELMGLLSSRLPKDREVVVLPPFTSLWSVGQVLSGQKGIHLGAQNFYPANQGAFTGEISPAMLKDLGCVYALAGHSERRLLLGEKNVQVGKKVRFGLEQGLRMILCVGETLAERRQGQVEAVLDAQLCSGLEGVSQDTDPLDLAVAYEPVWAIGTGEVAGPREITAAHGFLRQRLLDLYPSSGAQVRILYGGSVKPDNCGQIIVLDNVDGVLVGGASLNAGSFRDIVLAGV